MKYILGILVIFGGIFMVIKTENFVSIFGRNAWAEEHLGNGGTYLFYKLLGIIFIFGSIFLMTGVLGAVFMKIFGRLFVGLQ